MLVAAIDWTQVILAGIGALVAIINGLGIALVYLHIRTPSGDRIGRVAERTHDLSAADLAATTQLLGHLNGESGAKPGD